MYYGSAQNGALTGLAQNVYANHTLTVDDIARRMDISPRVVNRYVDTFRATGEFYL